MASSVSEPGTVQTCRARNRLRQDLEVLVSGTGLRIRELTNELVITNPRDLEKGQIHVAYSDGYVSWERTVWEYLGNLQGYGNETGEAVLGVSIEKILARLGGRQGE
jgi:hypothetical protein